jgi:hypothetical protein
MLLDKGKYATGMYVWRVLTKDGEVVDVGKFVVNEMKN